jgi:hypothetical protein
MEMVAGLVNFKESNISGLLYEFATWYSISRLLRSKFSLM